MHPISISLKGSREKPAWANDGQIGPLGGAGQEEGSLRLPLCAECHHVTGAEARPGTLGKGQMSSWLR